jgi:hypothetical protein
MESEELRLVREALSREVKQGSVGIPRFFQCLCHTGTKAPDVVLRSLIEVAEGLFESKAADQQAYDSASGGHVTSLLRWASGQSAILTVVYSAEIFQKLDVMLLGSGGACYYSTPSDARVNK